MTLDQRITHAAARVAVAWSNMDDDQAREWQAEVDRLMDARDLIERLDGYTQEQHQAGIAAARVRLTAKREDRQARARAAVNALTFDVLKGSPDHSGRLSESIARLERRG